MRTNNCLAIRDLGDFGITFYIGAYLVQIPFITHTINRIKYKPLIDVDSEGTNFYFSVAKLHIASEKIYLWNEYELNVKQRI